MRTQTISRDPWAWRLLGEHQFEQQRGLLPWWYRLTSPPTPLNPTLVQRDLARRSKMLSALALFLACVLVLVASVAVTGPNKQILTTVLILYPTIALCLLLNRRGQVMLAGLLLLFALVGGMYFTLFMTAYVHGGLTPNDKDILYLPFFGQIVAAALLPTFMIFVVAGLNLSVSLFFLFSTPHTPAFSDMLATGASSIVFRLAEIHVFTAFALAILASTTLIALKRADRAEEVARLTHDLQEASNDKLRRQEHLAAGLEQLSQVHARVANGDLSARVSLSGEQVLYPIAVPLNNLLSRYQHALRQAEEGEVLRLVIDRLVQQDGTLRQQVAALWHEVRTQKAAQATTRQSTRS